jgi:hypothetical protein
MADFPVIEVAIGAPDGSNLDFYTSSSYLPGTTVVFLNGIALVASLDNGWIEQGNKRIHFKQAPSQGDVVQLYYVPI